MDHRDVQRDSTPASTTGASPHEPTVVTTAARTVEPPPPRRRARWWTLVPIAIVAALVIARLPAAIAVARASVPADISAQVDDEALLTLSFRVGAILFVIIAIISTALVLWLARVLDERITPTTVRRPIPYGPYQTQAICGLFITHGAGLALGGVTVYGHPFHIASIGLVSALSLAAFWRDWWPSSWRRRVVACSATVVIAIVLCIG